MVFIAINVISQKIYCSFHGKYLFLVFEYNNFRFYNKIWGVVSTHEVDMVNVGLRALIAQIQDLRDMNSALLNLDAEVYLKVFKKYTTIK